MTLTLDFQGQILKKSYRRNGMAHWNGTKGMWVDRMLDSHCDFKLWPHPWPWPWIFKVKYGNCCNSTMGGLTHLEWKGCELDMMLDAIVLASHPCTCVLQRQLSQLYTLKLPKFFHFHGDFHQNWYFAHPKISFAHPELPFLAKSMLDAQWDWPAATVHGR